MTPEAKIKAAVKRQLERMGCYQHWPVMNGMGAPTLDCIACYRGHYLGIECKAPGKVPTPRQEATMGRMAAAGAFVFVISSKEGAEKLPDMLLEAFYGEGRDRNSGS